MWVLCNKLLFTLKELKENTSKAHELLLQTNDCNSSRTAVKKSLGLNGWLVSGSGVAFAFDSRLDDSYGN